MDQYQEYIHLSRYAKWNGERRENLPETTNRYLDFFQNRFPEQVEAVRSELYDAITQLTSVPSMRAFMTAGEALARDEVAGYNCSYDAIKGHGKEITLLEDDYEDYGLDQPIKIALKNPIVFDEILYILMCGVGVGFSVERQYIQRMPTVNKSLSRNSYKRNNESFPGVPKEELSTMYRKGNRINIADSKYGWASALRILIVELYNGNFDITWDLSKLRPAGAPLKTFGGRSSGPEPLDKLFKFVVNIMRQAEGRKLNSIECHDIVCSIGAAVVVGGVRRSACISLSNLSDQRMQEAKSGDWWETQEQRQLANNSVAYTEKPDIGIFLNEWRSLYMSKSGERGIFNREAASKIAARNGRRKAYTDFGTNPCSEIILRMQQFCNLSEVIIRAEDNFQDVLNKMRLATIFGTLQATLTNFIYLNDNWRKNTEEEALLGVSLTGIMDHSFFSGSDTWQHPDWFDNDNGFEIDLDQHALPQVLEAMTEYAIQVNADWAKQLGINPAAAITAIKPSGTVSQLVNSSSGIHARFSPYYIRTVRNDSKDPLCQFLKDQGVPNEPAQKAPDVTVFSFPVKSPHGSILTKDRTAIEQLELWLLYQNHYCEHKPSITIYVKEEEWLAVASWVYDHFDVISGVSFLPHDDHIYPQAPYQEISEDEYEEAVKKMPVIDWALMKNYETVDMTTGSQEYACSGNACEIL